MGLSGGQEVCFNAKMHLERTALKPAATAFYEMRRFWRFRDAEQPIIKRSRLGLAAEWHGQLHMVKRFDWHCDFSHQSERRVRAARKLLPHHAASNTACLAELTRGMADILVTAYPKKVAHAWATAIADTGTIARSVLDHGLLTNRPYPTSSLPVSTSTAPITPSANDKQATSTNAHSAGQ
jgi:hypothetical protein